MESSDEFILASVQTRIEESDFQSVRAFATMIQDLVHEAVAEGADLIVFPEYLNVFLASVPYHDIVDSSSTVAESLTRIFAVPENPENLLELFSDNGDFVRRTMDQLYGSLANKYDVYILAGTYFAPAADTYGNPSLTNRSVLYNNHGVAVHEQDKVYLTPFENDFIGLSSGHIADVEKAEVFGMNVGITICRDTFFPVWDTVHQERDLWIDLRAEGTEWVPGREDFTKLMPERLEQSSSAYGTTVTLTGEFLELFWQGKSSVFEQDDGKIETTAWAETATDSEVLIAVLQRNNYE